MSELRDDVKAPADRAAPKKNTTPERAVLALWREAQAVCFDVDCTVLQQDSLDLLAEYLGRGEEVSMVTNQVQTCP